MKKNLWLGIAGLMLAATLVLFSQTSSQFPELDKNGKPVLRRRWKHKGKIAVYLQGIDDKWTS
jgi:hypothetical protein